MIPSWLGVGLNVRAAAPTNRYPVPTDTVGPIDVMSAAPLLVVMQSRIPKLHAETPGTLSTAIFSLPESSKDASTPAPSAWRWGTDWPRTTVTTARVVVITIAATRRIRARLFEKSSPHLRSSGR